MGRTLKKLNYLFSFQNMNKIKKYSFKNFFFKQKNLAVFNKKGDLSVRKGDINFINYLNKISKSNKKWKTYQFKKQYLRKFRYKKRIVRVRNYIQKNILSKTIINYYKVYDLAVNNSTQYIKNNTIYVVNYFELINLKLRFLKKYINNIVC